MKNFFFITILLTSLGLVSCIEEETSSKNKTAVSGYFENIPGTQLTLAKQTPEGIIPIDTAWVEDDGYFEFDVEFGEISVYRVMIDFGSYLTIAGKQGDHIILEANGLNVYDNYYVGESPESELIKNVVDQTMKLTYYIDSLKIEINHFKAAKNSAGLFKCFELQKEAYTRYHDFSINFIKEQPGSIAAYFVVTGLQPDEDPSEFILVEENLSKSYPKFNFLPKLQEQVGLLLAEAKVGEDAIELNFPNPEGDMVALSSFRGKYVLIDFWASWCKPCRLENPHTLELYEKYHDKGFEIYAYSLDEEKENWVNAIAEDGLPWIHTSDLKGWQAEGSKAYGVQAIPSTYLINPEGVIIAKNLTGDKLTKKLEELFGK